MISLVVIANAKSIINHKYAKKELKNQIVKYDQLTSRITSMLNYYKDVNLSIKTMRDIAEFILDSHKDFENAFITKYEKFVNDASIQKESSEIMTSKVKKIEEPIMKAVKSPMMNKDKIREELIQFRLHTSRKEEVKAYFIFNNKQLEDIMEKMPQNKAELMDCNGFGKIKVEKYGSEMIRIING